MKNLNQFPEPSKNPRTPRRRRRLNLARAVGAIAGIALLGLFGYAGLRHEAWAQPMPLAHKVVTTTSALPALPSAPATINDGQNGQVNFSTTTVYAGEPIVVSASASVPVHVGLPSSATTTPAGETVAIGPTPGGLGWRSEAGTDTTTLEPGSGWSGYASWFVQFPQPGTFAVPVEIGNFTRSVAIHVNALPPGAHAAAHTTYAAHPSLVVSNPGGIPLRISASGLPSVLQPGQSATVTPGPVFDVAQPQTAQNNEMAFTITQNVGSVNYSGTVTRHKTVAYRPAHPAFTLPAWFWLALALAIALLVSSFVAGLRGGRGGKGPGKDEPKGTGANAS